MAEQGSKFVPLPIEWHTSENLISRYSNNIVVAFSEREFVISFFEVLPPQIIGAPDEVEVKGKVRAECVARIIVGADQVPGIIRVLQDSLDAYRSRKGQE